LKAPAASRRIVALAGGVGAARFLRGLVRVVDPELVTIIVNTGDDRSFYGVHVSPDLDIVTYTLAGEIDTTKGYGLAGDRYAIVEALAAFGHETWFRLGDRDFATSLHRTLRLREGVRLAAVTDEVRRRFGIAARLLPMSEDPCPTYVALTDGSRVHFEEYLARDAAPDRVRGVDLSAARAAKPAPGVLEALGAAEIVLVCPSNPVVSIAPILAVPGVREALLASVAPVIGVSPIVGGAPIKGPADRLLRGIGVEVSARGVAQYYREWMDGFVIDERDAPLRAAIEPLGLAVRVTDTVMRDAAIAAHVAETTLELASSLGGER